jgi:peroxiredoxin
MTSLRWSACLLACLLAAPWAASSAAAQSEVAVRGAPSAALKDLDGREVRISDYAGRVVVLHFWATWCPACREEMPVLEAAARSSTAGGAVVLGVNLGERRGKVADYARQAGLTFPILLDPRGKAAQQLGVLSLPTTLVLGPDGKVSSTIPMGSMTPELLERRIDEARASNPRR